MCSIRTTRSQVTLGAACHVYRRFVGHLRSPVAGCCYRLWRHCRRRGDCVERAGIHPARIVHFDHDANSLGGSPVSFAFTQEGRVPLAGYLAQRDIIVNGVLQDANGPLTFAVRPNGNGFQLGAAPPRLSGRRLPSGRTSPANAVDHIPSYLGDSATWERSARRCFLLADGACRASRVAGRSDVAPGDRDPRRGSAESEHLSFQNRQTQYPHARRARAGREWA